MVLTRSPQSPTCLVCLFSLSQIDLESQLILFAGTFQVNVAQAVSEVRTYLSHASPLQTDCFEMSARLIRAVKVKAYGRKVNGAAFRVLVDFQIHRERIVDDFSASPFFWAQYQLMRLF